MLASTLTKFAKLFSIQTIWISPHMSYTIASNICEGIADCVPACPVACIEQGDGANIKGTIWFKIDASICIDCGVCLQVCPVQGAILPEERPELVI
jgi:NAD-dependent dihydropyrimidine dehydrogenase PreA subunit